VKFGYQFATSLSTWKQNFAQIGGFLYFGSHLGFKMATITNRNGRDILSDDLILCQVSIGSSVWSEFNIVCTLVTMATTAILNFFNPSKAATHYGGYSYKVS
jgi:hypothetical protein